MHCKRFPTLLIITSLFVFFSCSDTEKEIDKIDRFSLVTRHNVMINEFDSLNSLTVGNGEFAFTVDATGLQTFPEIYENGVCLGTMSEWGWHSFPNISDYKRDETFKYYEVEGREVPYSIQRNEPERKKDASNYFRVNPHRLLLGNLGLELADANQKMILPKSIQNIDQQLNLWEGVITSSFEIENEKTEVQTFCSPNKDLISVQVKSERLNRGLLGVKIQFPYPTGNHVDNASDWGKKDLHKSTIISRTTNSALFQHSIDTTTYFAQLSWTGKADLIEKEKHYFVLQPTTNSAELNVELEYRSKNNFDKPRSFAEKKLENTSFWKSFWEEGGIVDLSETADKRAFELERRIILSQYLTRIQCTGNYPPQETGLTLNSWYGKFHLEMHWWHAAHWAYWNRPELLEKSMDYYFAILKKAKEKAQLQGYEGARWPKMTDNQGNDSPSDVGEFLIWQEPHIIYFAEQLYRAKKDAKTLKKYTPLITETANFMADFASWDEKNKRFILGPPLIPAQESLEKEITFNPPFELAYWYWGLSTAQKWLKRQGLPANPEWQKVIGYLSEFAQKNGLYLAAESAPDSYENEEYYSDHPMVLGAFGILPETLKIDTLVMKNTFDYIEKNWNWERTWVGIIRWQLCVPLV